MTRDAPFRRFMPTGQAKFARSNAKEDINGGKSVDFKNSLRGAPVEKTSVKPRRNTQGITQGNTKGHFDINSNAVSNRENDKSANSVAVANAAVNDSSTTEVSYVKRTAVTPDSGFSEGPVASLQLPPYLSKKKPNTNVNKHTNSSSYPTDIEADFGTSSVVHVIEPNVSASKEWWHVRGYTSDPYLDGTLQPPKTPQSNAAREAAENKRSILETKGGRRKFVGDAEKVEPLLQAVQVRPIASREGTRPITRDGSRSVASNRPLTSSEYSRVHKNRNEGISPSSENAGDLKRAHSISNLVEAEAIVQSTAKKSQSVRQNIIPKKVSVFLKDPEQDQNNGKSGRTGLSQRHVSESQVIGNGGAKNVISSNYARSTDYFSPGSVKSNRITPPTSRRYRPPPFNFKGPPATKQDGKGHKLSSSEGSVKKPKAAVGPATPRENTTRRESLRKHGYDGAFKKRTADQSPKVETISSLDDDVFVSAGVITAPYPPNSDSVVTTPSTPKTTILIKRPQARRPSLDYKDKSPNDENNNTKVEITKLSYNRKSYNVEIDNRVKNQRKVSFVTEKEGEEDTMENQAGAKLESRRRRHRGKASKKSVKRQPTQREMDDDCICGVAAANRFSRQGQHPADNQQASSESEDEDENEQPQKPKGPWEIFQEQVKNIDDGEMHFSPRDLTSKSSDLFERVMVQIGPQFRPPESPPESSSPHCEEDVDDIINQSNGSPTRKPISAFSKFRSKHSWGVVRKTLLEKQMEAAKNKTSDAGLNWKMLCTTIHNMTDMERGREALYEKYIYEPNSWLKGFNTSLPTHVLKHSLRNAKNKDPGGVLRNIQSANGQQVVTVGHKVDMQDPTNSQEFFEELKQLKEPRSGSRGSRVYSSQGGIRVSAHKPGSAKK